MKKEDKKLIKKEDENIESLNNKDKGENTISSLKKQRAKLNKEIRSKKASKNANIEKKKEYFLNNLVQRIVDELKLLTPPNPKTIDVKVVNPPSNPPDIQKIIGSVLAKVEFPEVQNIIGDVIAKVKFPKVQRIKGKVKAEVDFPETQKISGGVTTDIPKHRLGKLDVVPIVFWDGKRMVPPDFGKSVAGDGKLYAAVQELNNLNRTQSVFYTGQIKVTASGTVKTLGSAKDIKTIVVQALEDNRHTIHITAGENQDYELQPGQPLTIVIDNLSKVRLLGSYINDGVCFAAS